MISLSAEGTNPGACNKSPVIDANTFPYRLSRFVLHFVKDAKICCLDSLSRKDSLDSSAGWLTGSPSCQHLQGLPQCREPPCLGSHPSYPVGELYPVGGLYPVGRAGHVSLTPATLRARTYSRAPCQVG